MADISKIKAINGTTYNLKDSKALHAGPEIMATNPFAGEGHNAESMYIPKIDNVLYCADKRFNVTVTGDYISFSSGIPALFNGNYDNNNLRIGDDDQVTITIDFTSQIGSKMPGYPYGYIFLTFYAGNGPKEISARVYNNYAPQTVGWKTLEFSNVFGSVWKAKQDFYGLQTIEITLTGDGSTSYGYTSLTQIDMWHTSPMPTVTPFLSKYIAETLYYPLTAPSFIGSGSALTNLNAGNISSGTLPVSRGGTGQTSEVNAANSLINSLTTGNDTPVDNDYFISQYVNGGSTTKTFHRRPISSIWNYIKGKISSVLGLSETGYTGSAAKVNNHTVNSDVPAGAVFTDTTYSNATTSAAGLMSAEDKVKLDNVSEINVYDGLDSTSTNDALSANQGKVLRDSIFAGRKAICFNITITAAANNGYSEGTFTFPTPFTTVPFIVCTPALATDARMINVVIKSASTSAVVLRIGNSLNTQQNVVINGIAIGY